MLSFTALFPDVARDETRSLTVPEDGLVPADQYLFQEFYCVEKGCDCRRVIFRVLAAKARAEMATINHALDRNALMYNETGDTQLEPFGPQSRYSTALMGLFQAVVLQPDYAARLMRHYKMVRDAVEDPTHPIHDTIARAGDPEALPSRGATRPARTRWAPSPEHPAPRPTDPCPCGSGRRYRKCCLRR